MTNQTPREAWVPAAVDPTDLDYPLEGPKLSGCLWKIGQLGIFLMAIVGAVAMFGGQKPTGQAAAAAQTTMTPTVAPTAQIQIITATPGPAPAKEIPDPTRSVPTATPIPFGGMATWTPGPWMLTKFVATYEAQYGGTQSETTPEVSIPAATPEK